MEESDSDKDTDFFQNVFLHMYLKKSKSNFEHTYVFIFRPRVTTYFEIHTFKLGNNSKGVQNQHNQRNNYESSRPSKLDQMPKRWGGHPWSSQMNGLYATSIFAQPIAIWKEIFIFLKSWLKRVQQEWYPSILWLKGNFWNKFFSHNII